MFWRCCSSNSRSLTCSRANCGLRRLRACSHCFPSTENMPWPSLQISQVRYSRIHLQRRKRAKSDRTQLEIFESSSQKSLDILWIASEEEPVPHNVGLERKNVSCLLLRYYFKSFIDVVRQLSSIVGLDKLDDICDTRRIWTWISRSRFAAQFLGRCYPPVFAPRICE